MTAAFGHCMGIRIFPDRSSTGLDETETPYLPLQGNVPPVNTRIDDGILAVKVITRFGHD